MNDWFNWTCMVCGATLGATTRKDLDFMIMMHKGLHD